jgi:hypothetical protein
MTVMLNLQFTHLVFVVLISAPMIVFVIMFVPIIIRINILLAFIIMRTILEVFFLDQSICLVNLQQLGTRLPSDW